MRSGNCTDTDTDTDDDDDDDVDYDLIPMNENLWDLYFDSIEFALYLYSEDNLQYNIGVHNLKIILQSCFGNNRDAMKEAVVNYIESKVEDDEDDEEILETKESWIVDSTGTLDIGFAAIDRIYGNMNLYKNIK